MKRLLSLITLFALAVGAGAALAQPPTPAATQPALHAAIAAAPAAQSSGSSTYPALPAGASYSVALTWTAPTDSADPVTGYQVYRAPAGASTWTLLNATAVAATSYSDTTVATGTSYAYYVVSVDAAGNQSAPSNEYSVTIPTPPLPPASLTGSVK